MKKGTFNRVIRLGNVILKLSREHTSVAQEMLKLDSKNVKKYEYDISSVGIKTSKVYLSINFNDKNIIIQEFINGETIQEYFDSLEHEVSEKLKLFKNVIELYSLSLKDDNLCLDWNLNNFIVQNNDIYYIDYVPTLYRDKINSISSERLEQYKLSLLDRQIQLAGILSHAIIPFFNETKSDLKEIYYLMKSCIENILKIKMNLLYQQDHVYSRKLLILEDYLNTNKPKEDFIREYHSISMSKTAYVRKKINE